MNDLEGEAHSLTNLGNSYTYTGQYEMAIECHKKSLEISANIEDNLAAATAIHNLSDVHRLLKDFELAILLGMRSLHIFTCLQSPNAQTATITLNKVALEIGIDRYAELIESGLQILKQEDGGEKAVALLRSLLFEEVSGE